MNFGVALELLKIGKQARRIGWNGLGQYVFLTDSLTDKYIDGYEVRPCLCLKNAQDKIQPGWIPSMGDLLAEDWEIL